MTRTFTTKELWHTSVWPLVIISVVAGGLRLGPALPALMAGDFLARYFAKHPVFTVTAAFSKAVPTMAVVLAFWGIWGVASIFALLPDFLGLTPAAHWVTVGLRLLVHIVVMTPILAATWAWFVVRRAQELEAAMARTES